MLIAALVFAPGATMADGYAEMRSAFYQDAMSIAAIKSTTSGKNIEACAIAGDIAANRLIRRYNGERMSTQMAEPMLPFEALIIKDAYKQGDYQTLEMKEREVRAFSNKYELDCYNYWK